MSDQDQFDAVKAALVTANPLSLDEAKNAATLPAVYTELGVTRRFGGEPRSGAPRGTSGYRITTRAVGSTEENAREEQKRAAADIENRYLTINGRDTTPIEFESADPIGEDDQWWSALTTWTYTY